MSTLTIYLLAVGAMLNVFRLKITKIICKDTESQSSATRIVPIDGIYLAILNSKETQENLLLYGVDLRQVGDIL